MLWQGIGPKNLLVGAAALLLMACSAQTKSENHNLQKVLGESAAFQDFSASSSAATETSKMPYAEIANGLKTSMLDCPARIWPNYDWKKMSVLMLEDGQPSLLWRGSTGQIESLPEDQIPSYARQGIYSFFDWGGGDAVAIYSDSTNEEFRTAKAVLELIIHEGFHRLGQRDWTKQPGNRGTVYPMDATPRIYRRLLYDRLTSYYNSQGADRESLAKAAFWFQKWKNEFPSETLITTDGYEGTARYVEYMGSVIAQLGCAASDDEIQAALKDKIASQSAFMSGKFLQLDSEGYAVGSLAAFSLRFIEKNTEWYDLVKAGQTPLATLLQNITPIADTIPTDIQNIFTASQDASNKEIGTTLDPFLQNDQNPDFEHIVFSSNSAQGSFSPSGFYLPKNFPDVTLAPLALSYNFKTDLWSVNADAGVVLSYESGPCLDSSFSAIVPKADVTGQSGSLIISGNGLKGNLVGSEQVDSKGISWFCAK